MLFEKREVCIVPGLSGFLRTNGLMLVPVEAAAGSGGGCLSCLGTLVCLPVFAWIAWVMLSDGTLIKIFFGVIGVLLQLMFQIFFVICPIGWVIVAVIIFAVVRSYKNR